MNPTELRALIEQHPDRGSLPVELVMAVCMKESSCVEGHFWRYEKGYRWLYGEEWKTNTAERIGQQCSWGPMQVMGATAREMGHTGPFTELFSWGTGIKYGMKYLQKLHKKHGNWPDTIAAYNAGVPQKTNGKYRNQGYVEHVLRVWNDLEHHVELKETEA